MMATAAKKKQTIRGRKQDRARGRRAGLRGRLRGEEVRQVGGIRQKGGQESRR